MIKQNLSPSEYLVTSTSPLRISVALSKAATWMYMRVKIQHTTFLSNSYKLYFRYYKYTIEPEPNSLPFDSWTAFAPQKCGTTPPNNAEE